VILPILYQKNAVYTESALGQCADENVSNLTRRYNRVINTPAYEEFQNVYRTPRSIKVIMSREKAVSRINVEQTMNALKTVVEN
jgi:hypothetical protein